MKLFLDTADIESIKKWAATGLIDGVTTNPTHLSKTSGDLQATIKTICSLLPEGQISVEITEKDPKMVYEQALKIAKIAPNVVVKIPCHRDYIQTIKDLVTRNIAINITLVFTLAQALIMAKLGVAYISPFVGRLDDIDTEGSDLLFSIKEMLDTYDYETQLLAASIRSVRHINKAIAAGVDIVTLPPTLMDHIIDHPLTDKGMEIFAADWKKINNPHFV